MGDYHINIYFSDEEGCYIADIPDLDGCRVTADTPQAALSKIIAKKEAWLQNAQQNGDDLPVPHYRSDYESFNRSLMISTVNERHVGFLAHEMLAPITTSKGYLDLLQRRVVGDLTENQNEFLENIAKNLEHLGQLVNDSRDVADIELGLLQLHKEGVDIRDVVEKVIEHLQPIIARHNQQVDFEANENLPDVIGDKLWLEQVITYLLERVIKYTSPGLKVVVTLSVQSDSGKSDILCTI